MDIADVADLAQESLSDTGGSIWDQAVVENWVLEAIRDYSMHFHQVKDETIATSDGVHEYILDRDVLDVINVEFPDSQDPPEYLTRLPRTDPRFWASDKFYDLELRHTFAPDYESAIWISAPGETGVSIGYQYLAAYYEGTGVVADITVTLPINHVQILIVYVHWKAATERLFDELQDPDRTIHLIDGMRNTVDTLRQQYDRMLAEALAEQVSTGWVSRWRVDHHDRIY
jgi:hypothetical protein